MKYKALYKNREIIKDIIIRIQLIRNWKDVVSLIKDIFNYESVYYLMVDENGNIR